ncbi:MAG: branched-chain amino acid ABC transporter permease [Candidatus Bathyarchaeia archaeon]|nr:branched-chain amino acid ABC transporter permease [Candidatus Bathyarchaeota archaeon]
MSLELFIQTIINGLFIGFLLVLPAMGMTLIFGIMRIFNIAGGDMVILGCYGLFWLVTLYQVDPVIGLPIVLLIGAVLGVGLYYSLIKAIVLTPGLRSLLTLFGLSGLMANSMLLAWSPMTQGVPVFYPIIEFGNVTMAGNRLLTSAFAIAGTIILLFIMKYTSFGRSIRATVLDWRAATLMGVNVDRIYAYGFTLGVALTVFSGALIALVYPFEPYGGLAYTLYAFCIVILGTVGDPKGCLVAGLIMGLALSFTGSYWTQGMSPAVAYIILVITFLLRPEGLFGKRS